MIEFLCAIPEEIGWAIVGFVGAFVLMLCYKMATPIIEVMIERTREERAKREKRERALPRRMGCQK